METNPQEFQWFLFCNKIIGVFSLFRDIQGDSARGRLIAKKQFLKAAFLQREVEEILREEVLVHEQPNHADVVSGGNWYVRSGTML